MAGRAERGDLGSCSLLPGQFCVAQTLAAPFAPARVSLMPLPKLIRPSAVADSLAARPSAKRSGSVAWRPRLALSAALHFD